MAQVHSTTRVAVAGLIWPPVRFVHWPGSSTLWNWYSSARQAAVDAVNRWIELFYNTRRLHSTTGYRMPAEARIQDRGRTAIAGSAGDAFHLSWWDSCPPAV